MIYGYWAFFGIFYLLILTYQDYKHKRLVDDRHNAVMLGLTLSLFSHTTKSLTYCIALTIVLLILYALLRKLKPLGEADINSISWIFYGFGIIAPMALLYFVVIFVTLTLLYYFFKFLLFKIIKQDINQPTAFYGVITLAYIFAVALWGMVI